MRYYLFLLLTLLLYSCDIGNGSKKETVSNHENTAENEITSINDDDYYADQQAFIQPFGMYGSEVSEDISSARQKGYEQGYMDGYKAGVGCMQHGAYYNDGHNYHTQEAQNSYTSGYSEGYNEGYDDGEAKLIEERTKEIMKDPHNWESEDVDGLYVYLDGVKNDDYAEFVASEYYDGDYIREGSKYFAQISPMWDEYEVTLGECVSSNLYKIHGSDIYIHFRWGLPDVSYGDEGILDWSGTFSTFYKKPN